MASDIELAINLIQARHRADLAAFGGLYAPDMDKYPGSLDTANLPCLLAWPGGGSFYSKGGGYKADHRKILIEGYVQPLGQNDLASRAVAAVRLHQAVRDLWITVGNIPLAYPDANAGYQITVESSPANPHSDEGVSANMLFGGVPYLGFKLLLGVRILWSV